MTQSTTPDPIPQVSSLDLTLVVRARIRAAIEACLEEELTAALGALASERSDARAGYRHGAQTREVVTQHGPTALRIPRGRLFAEDGSSSTEWRSSLLPRYQRRTRQVDAAILGSYLAGTNTRRLRRALEPLLGESNLSRSAISRIVGRLRSWHAQWQERDLSQESLVFMYLDGIYLPVRMARRVVKVPVLVALGVREDGQKVLVAMQLVSGETAAAWSELITDLARRGMTAPTLAIADGNPGLLRAVREVWPETKIQRCIRHKWENLKAHAPKHVHRELKRDYHAIVMADGLAAARRAYKAFVTKWAPLCPGVVRSLEEAGEELLTYYRFPETQWKCLRTTNPLERVNGEFRRRTKTQGSFRTEASAVTLLWSLIAFGQIALRKIDGWKDMAQAVKIAWTEAA